jgi:hypothetical protein
MTLRTFAAAALVSIAVSALAEGLAPPPGWGKPKPPPPANGTGQVTFRHGDAALKLPLNQVEFQELSKNPPLQMVSLEFVDAKNENKLHLTFTTQGKAGKVDDAFISGATATTKAGGTSKGNHGKTRCGLTVTRLTAKEVEGTASCAPMFEMDATTPARPVTAIAFSARAS